MDTKHTQTVSTHMHTTQTHTHTHKQTNNNNNNSIQQCFILKFSSYFLQNGIKRNI